MLIWATWLSWLNYGWQQASDSRSLYLSYVPSPLLTILVKPLSFRFPSDRNGVKPLHRAGTFWIFAPQSGHFFNGSGRHCLHNFEPLPHFSQPLSGLLYL